MNISIYTPNNYKTSQWAGGSTTQLFIAPAEADYANREFDYRLSTAVVELESSDFTPLPDVDRKLMILEGEISIHHQNHHSKVMKPFDVDSFSGSWNTSSKGMCSDFNVMCKNGFSSKLFSVDISSNNDYTLNIDTDAVQCFLYIQNGNVSIESDNKSSYQIDNKSLIQISEIDKIKLSTSIDTKIVVTFIYR